MASSISERRTKACRLIRWIPPEDEWHSVNTDGLVCKVFGNASTDAVILGKHDTWIVGFSKYIGCSSAHNSELWGAL